ncbi:hypothetical protein CG747_32280 [Streptomyces sp. CB02959]|uniref:hypothetical protein n=1 Tax=Streptomyces sp. CB02959 TaxID=2020330 RepID=UPI000C26EC39|nr:hypothetical protein [Streptomyces sp. CB02959]PJN36617.1 hypothetical protein CG747_32280 [Streptomyces sp. CB02959]
MSNSPSGIRRARAAAAQQRAARAITHYGLAHPQALASLAAAARAARAVWEAGGAVPDIHPPAASRRAAKPQLHPQ